MIPFSNQILSINNISREWEGGSKPKIALNKGGGSEIEKFELMLFMHRI